MPVKIDETIAPGAVIVRVSGKLTAADYEYFVPEVERLIGKYGKLKLLLHMSDFHGWEVSALWEDIKFDLKHFADISKLAMVGDKAWEKGMAAFCKPFTSAKIRYFDYLNADQAREWLLAD